MHQIQKTQQKNTVLKIEKKSDSYKLFIPESVEQKIRYLCQQIKDTEWSGTLFYKPEGNFEDGSLVIKCVDIFVMDIGTATYTEFDMSPDIINYMTENIELLDCQIGILHSHNILNSFFSSTDINTLKEEGAERNHFVSLIVNNAGKYTAGITRKVKTTKIISENFSYPTYEDKLIEDTKTYTVENEELEWFDLNIEFEKTQYSFQEEINKRLEEIKSLKQAKAKPCFVNKEFSGSLFNNCNLQERENKKPNSTVINPYNSSIEKDNRIIEEELPFEDSYWYEENENIKEEPLEIPYGVVTFDKNIIKGIVKQILTGSIIITDSNKINLKQWVKGMNFIYEKRFGAGEEGMKLFKIWADPFIEYLCWFTENKEFTKDGMGDEEIAAIIAYDVIEVLKKLPENKFIKEYINILKRHLL